jgi:hypothetical protein
VGAGARAKWCSRPGGNDCAQLFHRSVASRNSVEVQRYSKSGRRFSHRRLCNPRLLGGLQESLPRAKARLASWR